MNRYVNVTDLGVADDDVEVLTLEQSHELLCQLLDRPPSAMVVDVLEPTVDLQDLLCTADTGLACPRCGVRDVTYTLVALRSGDEGMVTVCDCRSCYYHWKSS